eukprot:gb/GEZN01009192.1/.p1 GENE.gb/GEZN01009192.1/~~gb/GEZN01009192.1/.p1  ORF type:complete len:271 (-),score=3.65 gb/GEZN01009192.1/:447-1259(-)
MASTCLQSCAACNLNTECLGTQGCWLQTCYAFTTQGNCTNTQGCTWQKAPSPCSLIDNKNQCGGGECKWAKGLCVSTIKGDTWECAGEFCVGTPMTTTTTPVTTTTITTKVTAVSTTAKLVSVSTTDGPMLATTSVAKSTQATLQDINAGVSPSSSPNIKTQSGTLAGDSSVIGDCYDGIQQQDEVGIDCEGRCTQSCPKLGHQFDRWGVQLGLAEGTGFHLFLAICFLIFSCIFYRFSRPWWRCKPCRDESSRRRPKQDRQEGELPEGL